MTRLVWGKPGDRRYETGVKRGVLYLPDGRGVPWNGLKGVEEDLSDIETTSYFFDGIKYMDTRYPGDFSATLRALTYPDEFLPFDGYSELGNGVLLGHQPVYDRFGISYRTEIGNDTEGVDHGYKIHVLYNLVAAPDNRAYETLSDKIDPNSFAWRITGVPEVVPGYRPTVHVIFDTTRLNPFLVRDIENILYGTDDKPVLPPVQEFLNGGVPSNPVDADIMDGGSAESAGPRFLDGGEVTPPTPPTIEPGSPAQLPPLSQFIDLINNWVLLDVVDNGDGTWTATGPAEFIKMLDPTTFEITSSGIEQIDADTYRITTTSNF